MYSLHSYIQNKETKIEDTTSVLILIIITFVKITLNHNEDEYSSEWMKQMQMCWGGGLCY